ncbi:MAG: YmaF family protein [Anaerotignum sp.]
MSQMNRCNCWDRDRDRDCNCWDWNRDRNRQRHVHEITGSTAIFNEEEECHNHRFATVSGEAIRCGDSHVHEVKFRTDFADGHFHEFCGTSSTAIEVGNGKHVHFASACTEEEDGHRHRFQVASLIESPLDFECD